jgi:hypothetical protein
MTVSVVSPIASPGHISFSVKCIHFSLLCMETQCTEQSALKVSVGTTSDPRMKQGMQWECAPIEKLTTSQKRNSTPARLDCVASGPVGMYRLMSTEDATIMAPNKYPTLTRLVRMSNEVISARIAAQGATMLRHAASCGFDLGATDCIPRGQMAPKVVSPVLNGEVPLSHRLAGLLFARPKGRMMRRGVHVQGFT